MELECRIGLCVDGLPVIARAGTSLAVIGTADECEKLMEYIHAENVTDYIVHGRKILVVDGKKRSAWDVVFPVCSDLLTYKMQETLLLIHNFPALVRSGFDNEWEYLKRVIQEHLYRNPKAIIIASITEEKAETLSQYFYGALISRSKGEKRGIVFPPKSEFLLIPDNLFIELEAT